MKKLGLHVDELCVESFAVVEDREVERGTVRGNAAGVGDPPYSQVCITWPGINRTCQVGVYTCPECASPQETRYDCGPIALPVDD